MVILIKEKLLLEKPPAGKTSYAWIWTKWGEQVAFYCDYD